MKKKTDKAIEQPTPDTEQKLLVIVANGGFAHDIIAATRALGADGATIIHGHGTAGEGEKFMGIHITPHKDVILVVTKRENATAIIRAVAEHDRIPTAAHAVCFSAPVTNFVRSSDGRNN